MIWPWIETSSAETGARLVANNERRLQRQRPRDADALALPTGKFVRIALGHVGKQPDLSEQLGYTTPPRARIGDEAIDFQRLADDLAPPAVGVERRGEVL